LIHGLEGSPTGAKAQYLTKHFELAAPAMDTSDFEACVRIHADALKAQIPDVVVGSSFGGAVAVALLQRGFWSGPTLLLAPAVGHYGVQPQLPEAAAAIIVHGSRDEVLPIEKSRLLAASGTPERVELVEVDDTHRLASLLEDGRLAELVREAQRLSSSGPPAR
jgi:pimeloyl-ACP methyl ester carboxylesterase